MEEDPTRIESVNVTTQAVRTTINGDTIVYNASAYKVMEDCRHRRAALEDAGA